MIELSFQQFVPSEVCLKCKGCCRFKDQASPWRPKIGDLDRNRLGMLVTGGADEAGYLQTIQTCGEHLCRFLNPGDNTCRVYHDRPFECSLYPFLISQDRQGLKVYVHLGCPYVQLHQPSEALERYVGYLKNFFQQPQTLEIIKRNAAMLHDYSAFAPELLHVFDLPFL